MACKMTKSQQQPKLFIIAAIHCFKRTANSLANTYTLNNDTSLPQYIS